MTEDYDSMGWRDWVLFAVYVVLCFALPILLLAPEAPR